MNRVAWGTFLVLSAFCADAAEREFSIPADSLARALHRFSFQADVDVAFSGDGTSDVRTPGVTGRLEPEDALQSLLANTGFGYVVAGRGFAVVPLAAGSAARSAARLAASGLVDALGASQPDELDEVVVTGTLVRGVEPVGARITISRDDMARAGATHTNQLLTTVPQVSSAFGVLPNVPTAAQGRTTFRPILRGLPPLGSGTTLVLVDGHNIVGAGIQQNSPDLGAIPLAAIERIELVLDGGSATYGSDAMAGTLNVITRSRFDGAEVGADLGGAGPDYRTGAVRFVGGRSWRHGGLVVAVNARQQALQPASNLPLPRLDLRSFGLSDFRVTNACWPGNVTAGAGATARDYALPALNATAPANSCDPFFDAVAAPRERQSGLYVAVSQALSDTLDLQLKVFGSDRVTQSRQAQLSSSVRISSSNPFFVPLPDAAGTLQSAETVSFSWSPVLGRYAHSRVSLDQSDVAATLSWHLAHDWKVDLLGQSGWSRTVQDTPALNTTALSAAIAGTTATAAFDPYDPAATNGAVLRDITQWTVHGWNVQRMNTLRAIADGPLRQLATGAVRGAIGVQLQRLAKDGFTNSGPAGDTSRAVTDRAARTVQSVFAELVVPMARRAHDGRTAVVLNLSGRFDNYQSIGDTANPRIAMTWAPIESVVVRASWGTAYAAPTLQDTLIGGIDAQVQINNGSAQQPTVVRNGDAASFANAPNGTLTGGGGALLRPVTATTRSAGVDLTPQRYPGLSLSATWWKIDLQHVIQSGCGGNFVDQLNDRSLDGTCYYYRPTLQQALALTSGYQITTGGNSIAGLYAANTPPYYIVNRQRRNFGAFRTDGVDFNLAYRRPFGWGTGTVTLAGTHYLNRQQQGAAGNAFIDQLSANFPPTSFVASVRAAVGALSLSVTANYLSGFTITGAAPTTSLGAFVPVNLSVRYQFAGGLGLSLNVDNIANAGVPVANFPGGGGIFQVGGLPFQGTLGRSVAAGLSRHF